jgi:hypothetical protein
MDDQHGNVIDGTERARQWRRSRLKLGTAAESTETRADAPKSIAGSLLVPAEMLSSAVSVAEQVNGDEHGSGTSQGSDPDPGVVTGDRPQIEATLHQNPFLAPQAGAAASGGRSVRPPRRRSLVALLTRSIDAMRARRRPNRSAPGRFRALLRAPSSVLRPTRSLAAGVVSFVAIAFAAVILTQPNTQSSPSPSQASARGRIDSTVGAHDSAPLAAAASPFAGRHSARATASHHARRVHARRTSKKRPTTHSATRAAAPAGSAATVATGYTPPPTTSGSALSSSGSSGYARSGSSALPAAQPTAQRSSPSNTPAFGSSGALGPGSSPNG